MLSGQSAMTLTALIDGERVEAATLNRSDWESIYATRRRGADIRCPGCIARMYAQQRGDTRLFAHFPGEHSVTCVLAAESPEHQDLKSHLVESARKIGATAQVEYIVDGGRIDVLVEYKGRASALEAQLSRLAVADAVDRTTTYLSHVDSVTWFTTGRRDWASRVPALGLDTTERRTVTSGVFVDMAGEIPKAEHPVSAAVHGVLEESYTYLPGEDIGYFVDRSSLISTHVRSERTTTERAQGAVSDICARTGLDVSQLHLYETQSVPDIDALFTPRAAGGTTKTILVGDCPVCGGTRERPWGLCDACSTWRR